MPERQSLPAQRYRRRVWPTMLAYVVLLVIAIEALEAQTVTGAPRYAFALLPSIPLVRVIALVAQAISSESDEFQRAIWAEGVLWGTAATMVATTVWGFLEMAGARHVPLYCVFPFLTGATLVAMVALRRRYQ